MKTTAATSQKSVVNGPLTQFNREDRCALAREVPMDQVPDPPVGSRSGRWTAIYSRVAALKPRMALEIPCPNAKDATYGRTQLRSMAKKNGRILSTSRNADSTLLYAWLEPRKLADA
jgi:hypothetical protein